MLLPLCWAATPVHVTTVVGLIAAVWGLGRLSLYIARMGDGLFFAGTAVAFVASRLGWLMAVRTLPVSDFEYYFQYGCHLARGLPIPNTPLAYYYNWWAYPLFLALVFRFLGCGLAVAKAVSLVLGAAAIPPLYLVAERCGGKAAARCSILFFVLWPVQLMFTSVTASEHLVLPLALTGFWFGIRLLDGQGKALWNAALSGLLMTLAMIVRPSVFVFFASLCLILLFRLRPWKTCVAVFAVFAAGFVLVDSGYARLFERFTGGAISPTRGHSASANLLFGWNYNYGGEWNPEDALIADSWPKDGAMRYAWAATRERIRSHGFRQTVELLKTKDHELWGEPKHAFSSATAKLEGPPKPAWLAGPAMESAPGLYQLFIVAACVAAAVRLRRGPPSPGAMTLPGIIIFGTLLHLVLVVSSRYSYAFMPALFVFAAMGYGTSAAPEKQVPAQVTA
jgi:hypothetical protein